MPRFAPLAPQTSGSPSLEHERGLDARLAVLDLDPLVVVVDRAVLEDLDERGALVRVRAVQHLLEVRRVDVDRARDERGARAERERDRVDRVVDRAVRASTSCFMPTRDVGEYWPLVRP